MKPYIMMKLLLEYVFASAALLLLSPIFAVTAAAVKLDSKGPVFYMQERLGKNGKVFKIIKFRTMIVGALHMGTGLRTYEGDSRITRVGKWLRKTSIDELPQLINILRGEMSLIGPRPPVPYSPYRYEDYDDEQRQRFRLRPGITGYAQVKVRNGAPWDERIKLDIVYVNGMSFWMDLRIFLLSFIVVIRPQNVYDKPSPAGEEKKGRPNAAGIAEQI